MAEQPAFETGLDRSEALSRAEGERLTAWYSDLHGTGSLDLVAFVPLLMENRPDILKRHRFVAEAKNRTQHIGMLANMLLFAHYYTVVANEDGILYEIIAARKAGATKAEVLDTIAFAYLHGGTNGLNAVGARSAGYLREWTGGGREITGSPWPEGWAPDPEAFRAGLGGDAASAGAGDLARLAAWYEGVGGELPAYVRLLAQERPEVLHEWRLLQESAITSLPKQLPPLLLLHLAIIRANLAGIRAAAAQARAFGVTRHQLVDVICWAMSYSGELGLLATGPLLREIVGAWPAQR